MAFVFLLAAGVSLGVAVPHDFSEEIEPILENHCFGCHGDGARKGGVSLDGFRDDPKHLGDVELWYRVWRMLDAQLMPPAKKEQPSPEERRRVQDWIVRSVFRADAARPDPGRVTIRRLNREEYRYTIRDLLDVDFDAGEAFPADDTGYGFDTVGDALAVSPLLLEKYLDASREIIRKWRETIPPRAPVARIAPDAFKGGDGQTARRLPLGEPHEVRAVHDFEQGGRFRVRIEGPVDGERLEYPMAYKKWFGEGPAPSDPRAREEVARRALRGFAEQALRRPADDPTVDRLMGIARQIWAQKGSGFEDGVAEAMTVVLTLPRFLFRAEGQPSPDDPDQAMALDEYALASRLSYFLWSSMPDGILRDLAARGELRGRLPEQVDRMLSDPKAERFVRNFVGQWLQTRDAEAVAIDARRVLGLRSQEEAADVFNFAVRRSMRAETEMLFGHLLREDGTLADLLMADFTFLNEPLARFYGIPGVSGPQMRKVALDPATHRGGILTHGSFLVVTSNPTRTSPVKRGLFILENLLGAPPPPPPPDVPPLEAAAKGEGKPLTMRELMAAHREQPMCASCHVRMDPPGLAFEKFNALGQYRDTDRGQPIDTAGELSTGESFRTPEELARVLTTSRRRDLYRCATEKMMTYALGRGIGHYDIPAVEKIVGQLERDGGRIRTLVHGVVDSAAFQMRRGEGTRGE